MNMYRGSLGDYGSHYPILAAAVARTSGLVLELGAGDWSTPMLHYMCKGAGRRLETWETDTKWLTRFAEYQSHLHDVRPVSSWETWMNADYNEALKVDVAFIDCAPGEMRTPLIRWLASRAHFIIAHDSERDYGTGADYKYEQVTPLFKYVSEFRRFRPYTLVLSNFESFEVDEVDKVWTPPGI